MLLHSISVAERILCRNVIRHNPNTNGFLKQFTQWYIARALAVNIFTLWDHEN